jgi:Fe2+ or Zn2+ uptake regulation protein
MNQFANYIREDQRLVILRVLASMPSYTANSSVLHTALGQVGHNPSRDQVKTEIHWLAEQGLVTIEEVFDLLVARITERGADVVAARTVVPGVKKPGA